MDIVYVYKKWPSNGFELRYSLRSLKNIQHKKVYIVGDKPNRIKNVKHIPVKDDQWNKYKNVLNKMYQICNNKEISDDFIYMHDDNFIIKPIKELKYYKRSTLENHCEKIKKTFWENHYYRAMKYVRDIFPDGYSYDVHTPIVFNKEKLRLILDLYWHEPSSKRSLYCNTYQVGWRFMESGKEDIKVHQRNKNYYIRKNQQFLSSDNILVFDKDFNKLLHKLFPNKCQYEWQTQPQKEEKCEHRNQYILELVREYKQGLQH